MTFSIRKLLLINVLIGIAIASSLTIVVNYYLEKQDLQYHFDEALGQTAVTLYALLVSSIEQPHEIKKAQTTFNQLPERARKFHEELLANTSFRSKAYQDKFQFQVLDKKNHIILKSAKAPDKPFSTQKEGFSSITLNGKSWRAITVEDPQNGVHFVLAEELELRSGIVREIASRSIYAIFAIYPLLGVIIWLIIRNSLKNVTRVASQVANRDPSYLDSVDLAKVPQEIKPLIIEVNKLFHRLKQAFEREKRFSADAAHELRTPLAALKTQAQVALKTDDPVERNNALMNVIMGVDRSTHVIQQLLTISRLSPEAKLTEGVENIALDKIAIEVIAELAPLAVEKNVEIELTPPSRPAIVKGMMTALSVLVRNLVDNAIRYTPEGGEVKVEFETTPEYIILKVIDSGPGIPDYLKSRVFERFFRILGTKSPGSGLGLAIVQQIAELHNAKILLNTPPSGRGVEFSVQFLRAGAPLENTSIH